MLGDFFVILKQGVVHFKSKLLEIRKICFILNSMQLIYNDIITVHVISLLFSSLFFKVNQPLLDRHEPLSRQFSLNSFPDI